MSLSDSLFSSAANSALPKTAGSSNQRHKMPGLASNHQPASQPVGLSGVGMLLNIAAAVEAQEAKIKAAIQAAAQAGDLALVNQLLELWATGPVSDVLAQLETGPSVQERDE